MDNYKETFETWNKIATLYQDKFIACLVLIICRGINDFCLVELIRVVTANCKKKNN